MCMVLFINLIYRDILFERNYRHIAFLNLFHVYICCYSFPKIESFKNNQNSLCKHLLEVKTL